MPIIEGIGDEVLASFGVSVLIVVATMAWYSTRVRPLLNGGAVYVVQIEESSANRRVLQVLSLNENALHNEHTDLSQLLGSTPSQNQPLTITPAATVEDPSSESSTETRDEVQENANPPDPTIPFAVASETLEAKDEVAKESPCAGLTSERKQLQPSAPDASGEISQKKTIRLKFLDDTQKIASVWLSETVGEFIRQNFRDETQRGQIIRLIYRGQLLRDDAKTLASYGLHDNCVLHCHVTSTANRTNATTAATSSDGGGAARRTPTTTMSSDGGLNLGRFVYGVFGLNFALLWLLCASFWQYISVTALIYLAFCTAAYATFLYHRAFGGRQARPVG